MTSMGPRHEHIICYLFGHDWSSEPVKSEDESGHGWPDYQCNFCDGLGFPEWQGPEGYIPHRLWRFKLWFCGFFIGHQWESTSYGEDGEWTSWCERCRIDGDDSLAEEEYNV